RLASDRVAELTLGRAAGIAVVPRLHRLVAARLPPRIQDLHQPLLDFRSRRADGLRSGVHGGTFLAPALRRPGNDAPIRTVALALAVDRLPQRHEFQEQLLAPLGLAHAREQVEGADARDLLALEVERVRKRAEAGVQGFTQGGVFEVLALCVLALA